jgi:poly-beta-1,6-N-acetyl-D-glucosamine biosynthesis protein PgaD
MSTSLIINARHQLRWHQRLASDTSTAVMWGGWLYLWRPFLAAADALGNLQPLAIKLLGGSSPATLIYSLMALVCSSGTLLLWNRLPARKAREAHSVRTLNDYAAHFALPEQTIVEGRSASVCVVHHDANGRIIGIEARA